MLPKFETMSGWLLFMRIANLARMKPSYTSMTLSCRHVGKGIEEVDERGELGVCGQESEDVPQMFPQSLKKVKVARSTLKQRKRTFG
jgi:hypothetical protein